MVKVAIVGASGYTGGELVRFLCRHPQVTISCITDLSHAGRPLTEIYPQFRGLCDLTLENLAAPEVARRAEIVFLAVPHKAAMGLTSPLLDGGCRVIDLSADFRLKDQAVYEAWYQEEHVCPQLLAEAVYGLPELNREAVRSARLVANPGCYPTSAGLALLPLLEQGLIDPASIIIDSKSGTTGTGRTPTAGNIFCEVNEAFKAYGVASHRHTPEIEQTLSQVAGTPVTVNFTPHLLPISRGILTTVYASLQPQADPSTLLGLFAERYADHPFVRVLPAGQLPNVSAVRGSNFCDIGLVADPRTGRVIVVSAIDNLAKGASGQAIQNMNLMCGLDERTGLEVPPLAP